MHELRSAVDSTMAVSLPAGEFRVYGARWHMLVLYASSSLLNAVLWISFASIDDDVAGATLMALGNGAPDVSSTVAAINSSSDGYQLSLGALTGAGVSQ